MFIFSYLTWNPKRELFTIPFINYPVLWYSLLFAIGFIVGYYIFFCFLRRYFFNYPELQISDIKDFNLFTSILKNPETEEQKEIAAELRKNKINLDPKKDSDKEKIIEALNNIDITLKKRIKVFFKGVVDGRKASYRMYLENIFPTFFYTIKEKTAFVADKVMFYVVIATIAGARIGHILFYENISYYISHPLDIFKIWEGGLASHGAAISIFLAFILLSYRLRVIKPKLSFLTLLDILSLPTAFAAVCIRIGNFFNQEILGKETDFWGGVLFLNPADGSIPVVRHPAQIYEAIFYLFLFALLLYLSYKPRIYLKEGRFLGIFLIGVFSFRFFIEYIKEKQSYLISNDSSLLMGQYLSIPFIIVGIILIFINRKKTLFS